MPQTYTVKQVADILGYSTNSIYTFLKEKRIKGVRVGKGRFRIPQIELDRLLQKKAPVKEIVVSAPVALAPLTDTRVDTTWTTPAAQWSTTGFFDWVIVSLSLLLGVTIPIVAGLRADVEIESLAIFMPVISVMFICGGIGLFLTKLWGLKDDLWSRIFTMLTVLAFFGFAVTRFLDGDMLSGLSPAIFAAVYLIGTILGSKGVASFVWLLGLTVLTEPLRILIWSQKSWETWPWVAGASCLLAWFIWWSSRRGGRWFQVCMGLAASMFVSFSFFYAYEVVWVRSFTFLLLALFALITPFWEGIQLDHRHDRRMVTSLLSLTIILLIGASVVVRIFEGSLIEYAQAELFSKVRYGRDSVENRILRHQGGLESLATNSAFVLAVQEENVELVQKLIQALYGAARGPRRISFILPSGEAMAQYPLAGDAVNAGERINGEYVLAALTGKATQITTSVHASASGFDRGVVIATPVLDSAGNALGAIVAWVYAEQLQDILGQFIDEQHGEHFSITDAAGNELMQEAPLGQSFARKNRVRYLTSSEHSELLGWDFTVHKPVITVLQNVQGAVIVVFSLLVIVLLLFSAFLLGRRTRLKVEGAVVDT